MAVTLLKIEGCSANTPAHGILAPHVEARLQSEVAATDDLADGVAAYYEKRQARFPGR
ncbi:MAG: hypothetical protein JO296_04570 [Pseudonocardiales bacterium]|nr:hypothetical protein [Pseudonocardiales bacterium]